MECPHCQSQKIIKNGKHHHQDGKAVQNYLCKGCGKRFSERTGTPMSRLRTPASVVSLAMKMRSEGMGIRASGRVLEKSHVSIMRWEQKLAEHSQPWSTSAPRQNLYAKNTKGLQRAVTVQRLVHNWVRPHVGLGKNKTPAMAIGLYHRPLSMLELLSLRGFHSLTI